MKRIASIDIFRALTMLTMLFVNDFAGMSGLPHWLHHAAADEDMMGFSDLVFPAFLFCVGLSIPFAVKARFQRGDNALQVLGHIAGRTLALVVMGIFSMNLRGVEGGLSRQVFTLLAVAGFFLVWRRRPHGKAGEKSLRAILPQAAGILLLAALVLYKDLHGVPFRHGWWGILGLIGWAYLPCAAAYVLLKGSHGRLAGFWLLTLLLCILNAANGIPADYSVRALFLGFWPGGWTHPALCASGMFTALLLLRLGDNPRRLLPVLSAYALIMGLLGMICHRFWIISKIQATPTWLFFCVAAAVAFFALLYWITDVKTHTKWARIIAPAGTATLTCYTIPYIWYAVQQLLGLHWPAVLNQGLPGLCKALVFSFAIIGLTRLADKIHLTLKL